MAAKVPTVAELEKELAILKHQVQALSDYMDALDGVLAKNWALQEKISISLPSGGQRVTLYPGSECEAVTTTEWHERKARKENTIATTTVVGLWHSSIADIAVEGTIKTRITSQGEKLGSYVCNILELSYQLGNQKKTLRIVTIFWAKVENTGPCWCGEEGCKSEPQEKLEKFSTGIFYGPNFECFDQENVQLIV